MGGASNFPKTVNEAKLFINRDESGKTSKFTLFFIDSLFATIFKRF
jgi:hypothetical protein